MTPGIAIMEVTRVHSVKTPQSWEHFIIQNVTIVLCIHATTDKHQRSYAEGPKGSSLRAGAGPGEESLIRCEESAERVTKNSVETGILELMIWRPFRFSSLGSVASSQRERVFGTYEIHCQSERRGEIGILLLVKELRTLSCRSWSTKVRVQNGLFARHARAIPTLSCVLVRAIPPGFSLCGCVNLRVFARHARAIPTPPVYWWGQYSRALCLRKEVGYSLSIPTPSCILGGGAIPSCPNVPDRIVDDIVLVWRVLVEKGTLLACHHGDPGLIPGEVDPRFFASGKPSAVGFLGVILYLPLLHSVAAPYELHVTLIGAKDLRC
ncbi:hypothetical protein PR048_030121 [Dryococelus australis]|uniref:Uncharacterized protein n=1 Tax=Dryococelus australis TaxID=614101 RepID=A0ABQ9G819_9NEOP|nr:hypothetical protein PR048_030121 [Dryococelus australis]